jgi:hypothetical protein
VLTASNELINIAPPGLNNTWPTDEWGWIWYNIDVNAKKDDDTTTFYTSASITFPYIWNITGPSDVGPSDNITVNLTVYVDNDRLQRLPNAVVNVTRVYSTATWNDINTTPNAWNHTGGVTNASGAATVTLMPNLSSFNWTSGSISIQYRVKYGNATTNGYYYTTISQKTLSILGKSIINAQGNSISNATSGAPFNLSVSVNNPNLVSATYDITVINSALNSSAQISNLSALTISGASLNANAATTHQFRLNVTGLTNITSTILITPSTSGFASTSSTHTFRAG